MACADERETHGDGRIYDVAKKISRFGELPIYVGFSGNVSNSRKIIDAATKNVKSDSNYMQILGELKAKYRETRDNVFREAKLGIYGVRWDDLVVGKLDNDLKKGLISSLESPRGFSVGMVLGGFDTEEDNSKINYISYPGTNDVYTDYIPIGSGSDRADIVIGDALHNMSPDERTKIDPYKGARILMEATQSAWKNSGVGGRTQLVWNNGKEYHEISHKESNFLNNMLFCEKKGAISRDFSDTIFKNIINDNAKSEELAELAMNQIGQNKFLKMFLIESQSH
jgi:hypothetical protein